MFTNSLTVATLALSVFGTASARHVPRKAAPEGWWTEGLENYDVYHTRYLALNCQDQHNTDFFGLCCHPMLATENLVDNRDPSCTPSDNASSSASAAEPSSTVDVGSDGYDPVNYGVDTGNNNAVDNSDNADDESDDEDDDEWECDDDDEEESSSEVAPTTTKKTQTSTKEAEATSTKESKPTSTREAEPTTTEAPEPTTTKEAEPTTTSSSGSGNGAYGGTITFYDQGGVAGACGDWHSNDDDIAAIAFGMYGNIGAKSALCGRKLLITNEANGNSVTVTIADACEACADTQFDLSTGAFNKLADPNLGLVDVTIEWL